MQKPDTAVVTHLDAALASRYRVEREVGRGGMATVYLTVDIRHNRRVALKVLRPELGAILGADRFLAEIQVTANLQHPNLLPLFDSGEAGGLLYYVMPYIEGDTLRQRLAREHQLPVDEAVRIARGVAVALDYAHRRGVIHRDLKPENILLHDGEPLVADFGIALAISNAAGERITQSGVTLGTPQYMSPEQAAGDRELDARSDIYSLGCVLYEMLVGEPPHTGRSAQAVIAKIMTEQPRSVRIARSTTPPYVAQAIDRSLAKLPADRFSTAHALAEALEEPRVVSGERPEAAAAPPRASASDNGKRLLALRVWQAAWILAVGATAWGWYRAAHTDKAPVVRFVLPIPPTDAYWGINRGLKLAVSHDGRLITYVGGAVNGAQPLYVRPIGEAHAHALVGTEGAYDPVFSPDGKWIAFMAGQHLKKVPVDGGTVMTVADPDGLVWGLDWLSVERIVISANGQLVIVPAGGGPSRTLLRDTASREYYVWPHVLPDQKTILYTRQRGTPAEARIEAVSATDGTRTGLEVPGVYALGMTDDNLVYVSSDGTLMAVPFDTRRIRLTGTQVGVGEVTTIGTQGAAKAALSQTGTLVYQVGQFAREVVAVDTLGRVTPIITQPQAFDHLRFSPDGARIALSIESASGSQIWIYELASRTLTRLTRDGFANQRPEWSPDGTRVLFRSAQMGRSLIWWQPADGSASAELLLTPRSADNVWEAVFAPDGHTLVYRYGTLGDAVLWRWSLDRQQPPTRLDLPGGTNWGPRFSPDGRWLAYSSDESGVRQVYVRPASWSGPRVQISDNGGDTPVWSRDGRRLFYVDAQDNARLMMATIAPGTTLRLIDRKPFADGYYFSTGHASYDVAPDDRHLLLLKPAGGDAEVVVALNWREELRERTEARGK
jgi:serine/threonine-protein kinase